MKKEQSIVDAQNALFPDGKPEPEDFIRVIAQICNDIINQKD